MEHLFLIFTVPLNYDQVRELEPVYIVVSMIIQ